MKFFLFIAFCPAFWASAQSNLDLKTAIAVRELNCPAASEEHPVTLNATLVAEHDSLAIVVKVALAPGWHIYEYVPPTSPYIPIERILELPAGIEAVGAWVKTEAASSANDPGVLIYEKEAVFIRKAVIGRTAKEGSIIKAGLYHQTCDLRQCFPPVEKIVELKY